ncbi:MAG TPA: hypothetical protein V6C63_12185 [Allocoleopsis sp.]
MGSNLGFLVKVMGLSALLAIAIKSVGPWVVVSATPRNIVVLWVVLLPSLALGIALGWRAWQQRSLL